MTNEKAKMIAAKYISNEVSSLSLAIDILSVAAEEYEKGWKDCSAEYDATWDRITAGKPVKK
jgi:hypothetical protein